jgi:membrane-anchored protein YejM (alkaline phosphatase superfamily)
MEHPNLIAWCMDSLRWDIYNEAHIPTLKTFTKMRKVYSRAGITPPSLYATFMNLSWYESNGAVLVPWMKRWVWVPREFSEMGYYCVFVTANPMLKLYQDTFSRNFDEYLMLKGCTFHADAMVNKVIKTYEEVDKPKFIFLLFMETHQPYPYRKGLGVDYINAVHRPISRQRLAVEALDSEFGRMVDAVKGTNTDIVVFSDHGDLDQEREGSQGHGPGKFHEKLFEIPYGRKTI